MAVNYIGLTATMFDLRTRLTRKTRDVGLFTPEPPQVLAHDTARRTEHENY